MPSARSLRRLLLWLAAICLSGDALASSVPGASYSFAVVPQFEQRKLFSVWSPIVEELERRTGLDFELVATLSVPEFESSLSRGEFDFVYTNPYHIYLEGPRQGYQPMVRDSMPLRGILVVPKDSPIHGVAQLDGKVLAVPSPNSIGASLLLRAELGRLYGVRMSMLFAKTHSSVYLHVASGLTDAGGGVENTLSEQPSEVRDALRILHTTQGFPSHPVAVHPRVAQTVRETVRQAFLDMADTEEGKRLLSRVPIKRLVSTSLHEYDGLRKLDLESFWVKESPAP
jgi:phosphonate transport system substrate-binding protein